MEQSLNSRFGCPRPPEKIETWEREARPVSLTILDETVVKCLLNLEHAAQQPLFRAAAQAQNMIWAMDEAGTVVIAVEELAMEPDMPMQGFPRRRGYRHPSEEKKLGHPTLLDGAPARIAGELAFDEIDGKLRWVLNANSGRYCRKQPPTREQLNNVCTLLGEHKLNVIVDEI